MPSDLAFARHVAVPRRMLLGALPLTLACVVASRPAPGEQPVALRIGGTGMALAAMRRLAEMFVATVPDLDMRVLPSLGTAGGLAAVAAGAVDLALAARTLNQAERANHLNALAYARTPMAFVTHPGVGLETITLAEAARILSGQMQAWPNGTAIRLIRRAPSDADWSLLRSLSPEMAEAVTVALSRPGLLTPATDQDNADALERLPGSFGAMSIGQLRAEDRRLVALALDGEPPSVEALIAGRYPLSRTLHAVWRDPPSPDVERFLSFVTGAQASEALTDLGYIPLAAVSG